MCRARSSWTDWLRVNGEHHERRRVLAPRPVGRSATRTWPEPAGRNRARWHGLSASSKTSSQRPRLPSASSSPAVACSARVGRRGEPDGLGQLRHLVADQLRVLRCDPPDDVVVVAVAVRELDHRGGDTQPRRGRRPGTNTTGLPSRSVRPIAASSGSRSITGSPRPGRSTPDARAGRGAAPWGGALDPGGPRERSRATTTPPTSSTRAPKTTAATRTSGPRPPAAAGRTCRGHRRVGGDASRRGVTTRTTAAAGSRRARAASRR